MEPWNCLTKINSNEEKQRRDFISADSCTIKLSRQALSTDGHVKMQREPHSFGNPRDWNPVSALELTSWRVEYNLLAPFSLTCLT